MISELQSAIKDTDRLDIAFEIIQEDGLDGWGVVIFDDVVVVVEEREMKLARVYLVSHWYYLVKLRLRILYYVDVLSDFPFLFFVIEILEIEFLVRVYVI